MHLESAINISTRSDKQKYRSFRDLEGWRWLRCWELLATEHGSSTRRSRDAANSKLASPHKTKAPGCALPTALRLRQAHVESKNLMHAGVLEQDGRIVRRQREPLSKRNGHGRLV